MSKTPNPEKDVNRLTRKQPQKQTAWQEGYHGILNVVKRFFFFYTARPVNLKKNLGIMLSMAQGCECEGCDYQRCC